jgi:hypothetical protein
MHTNEDEESQTADESASDLFCRDRTSASSVESHACTHVVRNKIAPVALEIYLRTSAVGFCLLIFASIRVHSRLIFTNLE